MDEEKLPKYLYSGKKGELSPEECKEYFVESPLSDWVQGDEDWWDSKEHLDVRVDLVDGKQTLFWLNCPVSHVCITPGARGIIKNYHFDIEGDLDIS